MYKCVHVAFLRARGRTMLQLEQSKQDIHSVNPADTKILADFTQKHPAAPGILTQAVANTVWGRLYCFPLKALPNVSFLEPPKEQAKLLNGNQVRGANGLHIPKYGHAPSRGRFFRRLRPAWGWQAL